LKKTALQPGLKELRNRAATLDLDERVGIAASDAVVLPPSFTPETGPDNGYGTRRSRMDDPGLVERFSAA
jgi:hypothetical protein